MRREELSQQDASRILAGSIRNMAAAQGIVWEPWYNFGLTIRDNHLYRVTGGSHFDRGYAPIASLDELLEMSDAEIFRRVTGEQLRKERSGEQAF